MSPRQVIDPLSGQPAKPCTPFAAAICRDAADICVHAADLAQRGEMSGSGDVAAQALGSSDVAYSLASAVFRVTAFRMSDEGLLLDDSRLSPTEARDCYLEAAAALQEYAATADAN